MDKLDLKKTYKQLYSGKVGEMVIVDVPKFNFLMVDGAGNPNTAPEYIDAIKTLYPVAYKIKFSAKAELKKDFAVMPLEGLWWAEDMNKFLESKDNWLWTMMIMLPDFIDRELFEKSKAAVKEKKAPASIDKLRFEEFEEGRAAQVMYIGPYADEGPTIAKLHAFLKEQGGKLEGEDNKHHEIYIGDPRRTDPAKLKTIIRQPF